MTQQNNLLQSVNVSIGRMQRGSGNTIADVPGVTVGHATLAEGGIQTGVTALVPAPGNLFREKLVAASLRDVHL